MSILPIYFTLKPQINWNSVSLFSASSLKSHFSNQPDGTVNMELANLGATLTNVNMNEGFATQSKLKTNLPLQSGRKQLDTFTEHKE